MANSVTAIPSTDSSQSRVKCSIDAAAAFDLFSSALKIYEAQIVNPTAQDCDVRIYDKAASAVNPAADVPREKWVVAANTTRPIKHINGYAVCATQYSARITQSGADTGTTAPSSALTMDVIARSS